MGALMRVLGGVRVLGAVGSWGKGGASLRGPFPLGAFVARWGLRTLLNDECAQRERSLWGGGSGEAFEGKGRCARPC